MQHGFGTMGADGQSFVHLFFIKGFLLWLVRRSIIPPQRQALKRKQQA